MVLDWISQTQNLLKNGITFILITVLRTRGSTPCGNGHKMLCYLHANNNKELNLWGSIGGGLIEHQVCQYAQQLLTQTPQKNNLYRINLNTYQLHPDSGQCCGGEVQLCFEVISPLFPQIDWLSNLNSLYNQQQDALLLSVNAHGKTLKQAYGGKETTLIQTQIQQFFAPDTSTSKVKKLLSQTATMIGTKGMNFFHYSDKEITMVIEKIEYSCTQSVVLFGCGHISRALVPIISQLPVKIYWVDDRPQEFELYTQQHANQPIATNVNILCQDFLAVDLPMNAYCLVITYSHQRDYEICRHILSKSKPIYLGLIGSTMKEKRFKDFLQQENDISTEAVNTLHCPIGEVYKTQKSPAAIAISIANHLLKIINQQYEIPSSTT